MDGLVKIRTLGFPYKGSLMPEDEHVCLIPDDDDNCIDCGKHMDMPEVGEPPDLGDIGGIIRLIDLTAKTYARMVAANTDPMSPELPRLRLVGNAFVRVPHKALYKQLFGPSYQQAKKLGYRGSFERWGELLQEAVEDPKPPLFS